MARFSPWMIGVFIGAAAGSAALADEARGLAPFVPPPAKDGYAYPDCYCTGSRGERVEMGERACLTVAGRDRLALCAMSQNNPVWRIEREGCPLS